MKLFQRHIAFRYLWMLIALHILNFSIDNPDMQTPGSPEDLNYNEMESIVELLFENVLGIQNAIPEFDDADNDGTVHFQKLVVADLYCYTKTIEIPQNQPDFHVEEKKIISYNSSFYNPNVSDRNFQPPEA